MCVYIYILYIYICHHSSFQLHQYCTFQNVEFEFIFQKLHTALHRERVNICQSKLQYMCVFQWLLLVFLDSECLMWTTSVRGVNIDSAGSTVVALGAHRNGLQCKIQIATQKYAHIKKVHTSLNYNRWHQIYMSVCCKSTLYINTIYEYLLLYLTTTQHALGPIIIVCTGTCHNYLMPLLST